MYHLILYYTETYGTTHCLLPKAYIQVYNMIPENGCVMSG